VTNANTKTEIALFGGGCFWCLEAVFTQLRGVKHVASGYAGGRGPATYKEVCSGTTGHAEVVEITFDPGEISYRDLLDVFFTIHDPTTLNRQGGDVGTQYRSVIFHHDLGQKRAAEEAIAELTASGAWKNPIVTELAQAPTFFAAEDYHQRYFERNASEPYCQAVVAPKVAKLRKMHFERLRA
jgi:peptide-methionine (S)-S-oxide reductase